MDIIEYLKTAIRSINEDTSEDEYFEIYRNLEDLKPSLEIVDIINNSLEPEKPWNEKAWPELVVTREQRDRLYFLIDCINGEEVYEPK